MVDSNKIVELSRPVEDSNAITQVASISAGNDIVSFDYDFQ